MKKITTASELKAAILELELEQSQLEIELHDQFNLAYESLRPINLIRSVFKDITETDDTHVNLLNSVLVIGAGYLSKVLFQGKKKKPLKSMLGTALVFGLQTFISKNPETLKAIVAGLLDLFKRRNNNQTDMETS
jgi:hypothetical protein